VADIYKWKAVKDSEPPSEPEEYTTTGLVGFNFEKFSERNISANNVGYNNPFEDLIRELWPGDPKKQLSQMNMFIDTENAKNRTKNKTKNVTEYEFWQFVGILLSASPFTKGGRGLWEKQKSRCLQTVTHSIDIGPSKDGGRGYMPKYCFSELRTFFHFAFYDFEAKDRQDPWHPVGLLIDGFNQNRLKKIAGSILKVLGESMSAFRPRTTKKGSYLGGLPHISYT
jgi:hypothetical protein